MFGSIVKHVAALAQCGEITRQIVPRIVIEMRACKHHIGRTDGGHVEPFPSLPPNRDPSATIRAPIPGVGIPPSSVAQVRDKAQMRSRALFAARASTIEADRVRQLLPIDWVEPAVLGADRHHDSMSQDGYERKEIRQHVARSTCRCVVLLQCRRVYIPFDYTPLISTCHWRPVAVSTCHRVGMSASRRLGVSAFPHVDVSTYRHIDVSTYRRIDVSTYRRIGVSAYRRVGVSACRRVDVSAS
ncbi:hypothetical protein QFZ54_003641 [Sphingomonas faeni]|nr:hypothetical protein [Sphingomonas faeni]